MPPMTPDAVTVPGDMASRDCASPAKKAGPELVVLILSLVHWPPILSPKYGPAHVNGNITGPVRPGLQIGRSAAVAVPTPSANKAAHAQSSLLMTTPCLKLSPPPER